MTPAGRLTAALDQAIAAGMALREVDTLVIQPVPMGDVVAVQIPWPEWVALVEAIRAVDGEDGMETSGSWLQG